MNIGDSNSTEFDPNRSGRIPLGYLAPLGMSGYDPVASGLASSHPELLGTLATFQASVAGGSNSFDHKSVSAIPGATASILLSAFEEELAVTNAGISLVMVGTNDNIAGTDLSTLQAELMQLVRGLSTAGVVPVLSTIPDTLSQYGGRSTGVTAANQVITAVARESNVPAPESVTVRPQGGRPMLLLQYGWVFLLAAGPVNALSAWRTSRAYVAAQPELALGYRRLIRGLLVSLSLPWVVMGVGCTLGGVPTVFHFLNPAAGGPFAWAWWVVLYGEFASLAWWAVRGGGAEALVRHPGVIVFWTGSVPRMRRYLVGVALYALAFNTTVLVWLN